jgi:Tol biopolymer transport system component
VIELVEGPTLAERIHSGAIPLDESLPIARQIADALEAAHEKGIVHRDLKPANIKLNSADNVKVLDFGLAKALQDDASGTDLHNSPTLTMGSTKAGMILLSNAAGYRGADWGEDDTIVFPNEFTSGLYRISASGGNAEPLTHLDAQRGETTHRWPQILPGGQAVIYTSSTNNNFFQHASIEVAPMNGPTKDGISQTLVENAYYARYLSGGYLAYVSQRTMFVAPFDAKALKLTGPAIPVLQHLASDLSNGGVQFAVSRTGSAIFSVGKADDDNLNLALFDRKGAATVLLKDQTDAASPHFSPDGKRIAFQKGNAGIWIYDIARNVATPMTLDNPAATNPVWTPDGQRITYAAPRHSAKGAGDGIFWRRADGSGTEEPLTDDTVLNASPSSWLPDGKTLVSVRLSPKDLACCEAWTITLDANAKPGAPQPFISAQASGANTPSLVSYPFFSPDGRWLLYTAEQTGSQQVYVTGYPQGGGKWQVSTGESWEAHWAKNSREIFYVSVLQQLMRVPYTVENGAFQPGSPELLFSDGRFELRVPYTSFDVSPDGQHFVMLQPTNARTSGSTLPTVILNWLTQVRSALASAQPDSK